MSMSMSMSPSAKLAEKVDRTSTFDFSRPLRRPADETGLDRDMTIAALQRIAAIDTLTAFPQRVLEIVCEALGATGGTYMEFGAPGAQSFAYVPPGPGSSGPTSSLQIPVRTEKRVEIVFTIQRSRSFGPRDQAFVNTIEVALTQSHTLLRRVDRLARSLSVVAGGRRMATALLDNEGGLSIVDGSVSILNRWFRPGSSLCAELREWACTQRADGLGTVSLDKSRPFVAPSVDVVLVAYWRGERRMGDLIEFEEQIYDGADLRCLGLTAREAEVLALLVIGSDANAIAQRVGSRPGTVKKQIESIYRKLRVHTRRDAVTIAVDAMMNPERPATP